MSTSEKKITQYLNEAHAMEVALVRVLQEQVAVTPRGRYRTALEAHLRQTRTHADRVAARRGELNGGGNPIAAIVGGAQDAIAQAVALAKSPLDLLRGSGGEEKVLKNAKDACATEALEIATYLALERLASALGDADTAQLAASIRADEEAMLERIQRELPALAQAVVEADVHGRGSYDIAETGAADAVRSAARSTRKTAKAAAGDAKRTTKAAAGDAKQTAKAAAGDAKRTTRAAAGDARQTAARQTRRVPGAARAEGAIKGVVAAEGDLPIAGYGSLTAEEIVARLRELSQVDLAKVEAYERKTDGRTTVLERIASLRGDEPWAGFDDATAQDVVTRLRDADDETAGRVREYERAHKDRATVLRATERERAHA